MPKLAEIFGVSTDVLLGLEEAEIDSSSEACPDTEGSKTHEKKLDRIFYIKLGTLIFPIFIIVLGAALLVNEYKGLDVSIWNILWSDALFSLGISSLIRYFSVFGIGITAIGAGFLLNFLEIIKLDLNWAYVIPALIIIWGISMVIDRLIPRKRRRHYCGNSKDKGNKRFHWGMKDGYLNLSAKFCDNKIPVTTGVFKGGDVEVAFGSVTLDLSGCTKIAPDAVLHGNIAFGDLVILLPSDVAVDIVKRKESFGDISVKGSPSPTASQTLRVDSDVSFGELVVKYI